MGWNHLPGDFFFLLPSPFILNKHAFDSSRLSKSEQDRIQKIQEGVQARTLRDVRCEAATIEAQLWGIEVK